MLLRPFDFFVYFLFFFLWFYFILFLFCPASTKIFIHCHQDRELCALNFASSIMKLIAFSDCFSCTLDLIVLHILVWAKCIFESVWCLLSDGCRVHHEKKKKDLNLPGGFFLSLSFGLFFPKQTSLWFTTHAFYDALQVSSILQARLRETWQLVSLHLSMNARTRPLDCTKK